LDGFVVSFLIFARLTPADKVLSVMLRDAFVQFAAAGDPSTNGQQWAPWDSTGQAYNIFNGSGVLIKVRCFRI
jgi:hypothetical protein